MSDTSKKKMFDTSVNDFSTPVVFRKFKQSSKNQVTLPNKNISKITSRKRQLTLHQMVKENLRYSDVNPEHLQMALALSRSISQNQNDNINDEKLWDSDSQKHEKKGTLLEFGFKAGKIKMSTENRINKKEPLKTHKKSKFRYITPILYLRSEEDRESLIQSKISLILTRNIQENSWEHEEVDSSDIMSEELFKINCSECSIFRLNQKFNKFSMQSFSVPDLNILENRTACGCLLKDWKNIPLREPTPERSGEFKACSKKLSDLKDLRECEDQTDKSKIDELNSPNLENFASNVHEKPESGGGNVINENSSELKLEDRRNVNLTMSPDLFEDDQLMLSTNVPSTEKSPTKAKKKLEKLFSEVNTLERNIILDDTITLPSSPIIHEHLQSSIKRDISMDGAEYSFCLDSHVSESIVISSSSDEEVEMNNIEKNDKVNRHKSKLKNPCFINSVQEKNCYFSNISETSGPKCNDANDFLVNPNPKPVQNYLSNLDTGLETYDVPSEYTNHHMEVNLINCMSKLDENVSIHNSDEKKGSHENNICSKLQGASDVGYKFDAKTELHSRNDIPRIHVQSHINFQSIIENSIHENEKQCSSKGIANKKLIINKFLVHEKENVTNLSPVDESISYIKNNSYIDENNFVENRFTPCCVQHRLVSVDVGENLDKTYSYKSLAESDKDITSLNVTEHIEEMLARTYSPITSSNLSHEGSKWSYEKQKKPFQSKNISASSTLGLLQNTVGQNNPISANISLENCQHIPSSENCSSPTYDIYISDEEIDYSSNIRINENNFEKNNGIYESENDAVLKGNKVIGHPYTTLKRFASFTDTSTPKRAPSFAKYKSESDITPKGKLIIETQNITPMKNYAELDTPDIVKELDKYGLKPLKRKRGVNLLKHIYEATHPIVEMKRPNVDETYEVLKKVKKDTSEMVSTEVESTISDNLLHRFQSMESWKDNICESDLIFERRRPPKISTCNIPLQIVWHNFLVENPEIRKNILLYEPLQVDVINKMLKDEGFKFHVQDLLTFLDRKCITIKISQNHNIINN